MPNLNSFTLFFKKKKYEFLLCIIVSFFNPIISYSNNDVQNKFIRYNIKCRKRFDLSLLDINCFLYFFISKIIFIMYNKIILEQ